MTHQGAAVEQGESDDCYNCFVVGACAFYKREIEKGQDRVSPITNNIAIVITN